MCSTPPRWSARYRRSMAGRVARCRLDTYFAMARGRQGAEGGCACGHDATGVPALEMTKWFDTNYHYMVPEFQPGQRFALASTKPVDEFREALGAGLSHPPGAARAGHLPQARQVQGCVVRPPVAARRARSGLYRGAAPAGRRRRGLGADRRAVPRARPRRMPSAQALRDAYGMIAYALPKLKIMLTTYFGGLGGQSGDGAGAAGGRPAPRPGARARPARRRAGQGAARAGPVAWRDRRPQRLACRPRRDCWTGLSRWSHGAAPITWNWRRPARCCTCRSTSTLEADLDPDLKRWLSPSLQKMDELAMLGRRWLRDAPRCALTRRGRRGDLPPRRSSPKVHDAAVAARTAAIQPCDVMAARVPSPERREVQRAALKLPPFPTTTIGSFPQTEAVRKARAAFAKGELSDAAYEAFLRNETEAAVRVAGGDRPRRAGARRVRAQRHGAVFRRAARRLRLHQARLGAELRLALRAPADHLRRRVAPRADDGARGRATRSR